MSWKIKIKEDLKGGILAHFLWKFTRSQEEGFSLVPAHILHSCHSHRKSGSRSWEERKWLKQDLDRFQLSKSKMATQKFPFHGLCRKLYLPDTLPSRTYPVVPLSEQTLQQRRHEVTYRNNTHQYPSAPLKVSPSTDNIFSCEKCSDLCLLPHTATHLWGGVAAEELTWMWYSLLFLKKIQDLSLWLHDYWLGWATIWRPIF